MSEIFPNHSKFIGEPLQTTAQLPDNHQPQWRNTIPARLNSQLSPHAFIYILINIICWFFFLLFDLRQVGDDKVVGSLNFAAWDPLSFTCSSVVSFVFLICSLTCNSSFEYMFHHFLFFIRRYSAKLNSSQAHSSPANLQLNSTFTASTNYNQPLQQLTQSKPQQPWQPPLSPINSKPQLSPQLQLLFYSLHPWAMVILCSSRPDTAAPEPPALFTTNPEPPPLPSISSQLQPELNSTTVVQSWQPHCCRELHQFTIPQR